MRKARAYKSNISTDINKTVSSLVSWGPGCTMMFTFREKELGAEIQFGSGAYAIE